MRPDLSRVQQVVVGLGLTALSAAVISAFRRRSLRETQRVAQAMLDALPNPVYLKGTDGRFVGVNSAWEAFLGIRRDAVIGRTADELGAQARSVMQRLERANELIGQSPGFHVYEEVISLPDGTRHDTIVCKATCVRSDGRIAGLVGTIIDTTDTKRAQRRMTMEHAVTRALAEAQSVDAVVPTIIETICTTLGWHYGAMYRYLPEEGELRCEEMWGIDAPAVREFMAAIRRRIVRVDEPDKGLIRRTFALGRPLWISDIAADDTLRRRSLLLYASLHTAFAFPVRAGNEVLGILEFFHPDVLEPDPMLLEIGESIGSQIGQYIVRRRAETAKHVALHDAVTGLPSRPLFMEKLDHALTQAQRHQRRLAVMFIDLDRFKEVNDTLGHEAGDALLKEVARRLRLRLRKGDTVARLGGDEFVMLLEEMTSTRDSLLVAQKLVADIGAPYRIAGHEVTVTASIGVSRYPADAADAATLLRHADAAMYRAKAKGRNLCQLYSDRAAARLQREVTDENAKGGKEQDVKTDRAGLPARQST